MPPDDTGPGRAAGPEPTCRCVCAGELSGVSARPRRPSPGKTAAPEQGRPLEGHLARGSLWTLDSPGGPVVQLCSREQSSRVTTAIVWEVSLQGPSRQLSPRAVIVWTGVLVDLLVTRSWADLPGPAAQRPGAAVLSSADRAPPDCPVHAGALCVRGGCQYQLWAPPELAAAGRGGEGSARNPRAPTLKDDQGCRVRNTGRGRGRSGERGGSSSPWGGSHSSWEAVRRPLGDAGCRGYGGRGQGKAWSREGAVRVGFRGCP